MAQLATLPGSWAMALGLRPLPGPPAKPGLRPRPKPDREKVNGHKLGAMAQDIRYPGGRVGKACGPQMARLAWLKDTKSMLTITIMGLSHYPRHGHGLELWPCLGLAQGKIQRPTANGHMLWPQAMAQDIKYPWVRVG